MAVGTSQRSLRDGTRLGFGRGLFSGNTTFLSAIQLLIFTNPCVSVSVYAYSPPRGMWL